MTELESKRRRSPQENKALAYRKDHVVAAEYPHAFRRYWPRKKARSHRAFRRRIHQLLDQVQDVPSDEDDQRGDVRAEAVRRVQVRKWGVVTLRQHVVGIHERRIQTTAWNFFKRSYDREAHRARFAAFLGEVTANDTPYLREVASFFSDLLEGGQSGYCGQPLPPSARHRDWLRAFLADEPEWEPRLHEWIAQAR